MRSTWAEFEALTRKQQLTPIGKRRVGDVTIALAEGSRAPDKKMSVNHWVVTYAVAMDSFIDAIQVIRIPKWIVHEKLDFPVESKQETRIDIAMEAAINWVAINKQAKRY